MVKLLEVRDLASVQAQNEHGAQHATTPCRILIESFPLQIVVIECSARLFSPSLEGLALALVPAAAAMPRLAHVVFTALPNLLTVFDPQYHGTHWKQEPC